MINLRPSFLQCSVLPLGSQLSQKIIVTLQSTTAVQCTVKHKIKQIQYFHKKYSFSELKSRDSISSSKFLGSFVFKRGKRSWGNHQNWTLCCLKSLPLRRNLWLYWKNERVCKECQTFCKNIKTVLVIVLCCSTMRRLKETGNAISPHFIFFHLLSAFWFIEKYQLRQDLSLKVYKVCVEALLHY